MKKPKGRVRLPGPPPAERKSSAPRTRRLDLPRPRTLASLQALYLEEGAGVARRVLLDSLPPEALLPYSITRRGEGRPSVRSTAAAGDDINYQEYSAPSHWEPPYSVLRAKFTSTPKTTYQHHPGEELALPVNGVVKYHSYWSPGARPARCEALPDLLPGEIMRIAPEVPHHTWAASAPGAEAWMIFRDISGSSAGISHELEHAGDASHPTTHSVTEDEFTEEPGVHFRYASVAWGIAERLRFYRERLNLRSADVARRCLIDASHLHRIENGDANVSLEVLSRLAHFLHIDLQHLIPEVPWNHLRERLPRRPVDRSAPQPAEWCVCPPSSAPHFLHVRSWNGASGPRVHRLKFGERALSSSLIMLEGSLTLRFDSNDGSRDEILSKESVIHFRGPCTPQVRILDEAHWLEITYTQHCPSAANVPVRPSGTRPRR